ncbi:hypothetical protein RDWZM_003910 [Blomia tropicalis]|uniref:SET domain-containing protein n=1 Tax=Blomia tropicalis TaxID=40697 RepID=A0A9Q0MK90_BLOTA|nr:SET (Su(var)3-9, Enhancer-of-zeste, Trithorax) domain [Blomia tropicalis]KAJ6225365.1 hypothetical protein RDWZM_003910 [Blomia tropicalis]
MPCRTKSVTAKAKTLKVPNSKKPTSKTQTKSTKKKQTKAKEDTKENRCITDFFPIVSRRALAAKVKLEEFNRQIQKCIETRTDPTENLIVTHFDEKGKGIVAGTALNKGSFICEYSGDLIDLIEAKARESKYEQSGAGCYMYYFNWNSVIHCVDATLPSGRLGRLINHSRKAPNCKTTIFEHNGQPHLIFIALRDIEVGEEILYDYGERDPKAIRSNPWITTT